MKKTRTFSIILFSIAFICLALKAITESFPGTASYINADGFLIEPFFGLLPLAVLFITIGSLLVIVQIIHFLVRRQNNSINK
ncbi:DUF3955 domain-containing protein [Chryseobacterium sp. WG23]|uniref:DUF3955 domain-containing protein n=1 Tax=Chryseobacterium sp. WG23 TaxID=2926910 RepID=UPI00211F0565|nr:DUF3955 domain-containing protein [Chryseobacterium sp. WG23]MCQ9634225.1 DUF3955 domain-containing protein [Chryseobacterium sp. WG23]